MENTTNKVSSGAIQLYDLFIHGEIDRRAFMEGLQKFTTAGMTVAALAQALMPNYAAAQQVSRTDERIKAGYEAGPVAAG
jgi:carboxymethylenebutenolidase